MAVSFWRLCKWGQLMTKAPKRKVQHQIFNHDNVIKNIDDQKILEKHLALSRSQAWRIFTGKSKLSESTSELLMLKLDIHPTQQLIEKA